MSLKLIKGEVVRFLHSSQPEVICIMGHWGVGKTYAWNQFLQNAVDENKVKFNRYSYVSLFGQDTLIGLKNAIFENTTNLNGIKEGPTIETFKEGLSKLEKGTRLIAKFSNYVPQLKDYLPGLFLTVRHQIVCIDDLERIGDGLSVKNVLGLISFLKEQRKCKVVLLLNDKELKDGNLSEFKNQLEKVIDVEMKFDPSPHEATEIAIDKSTPCYLQLSEKIILLAITNIRVIKKIERFALRFWDIVSKYDIRVYENSLVSLVLFGWITYEPTRAPTIEFVKSFNSYRNLVQTEVEETDQAKQWNEVLNSLGFSHFDDFDQVIIDAIERGYFDSNIIEQLSENLQNKIRYDDGHKQFNNAWEKFHNSFDDNEDSLLDGLYEAIKIGVNSIDPRNADSTIDFLRRFGRVEQADELVDYYFNYKVFSKRFFDTYDNVWGGEFIDHKFASVFKLMKNSRKDTRSPKDVLLELSKSGDWDNDEIALVSELSVEDFISLFKSTSGHELGTITRNALRFREYQGIGDSIGSNAEEALRRIGRENRLNMERIKKYKLSK